MWPVSDFQVNIEGKCQTNALTTENVDNQIIEIKIDCCCPLKCYSTRSKDVVSMLQSNEIAKPTIPFSPQNDSIKSKSSRFFYQPTYIPVNVKINDELCRTRNTLCLCEFINSLSRDNQTLNTTHTHTDWNVNTLQSLFS